MSLKLSLTKPNKAKFEYVSTIFSLDQLDRHFTSLMNAREDGTTTFSKRGR